MFIRVQTSPCMDEIKTYLAQMFKLMLQSFMVKNLFNYYCPHVVVGLKGRILMLMIVQETTRFLMLRVRCDYVEIM